jgi:ABC-type branched-subunit amino acid transport system substrate-binding protein
MRRLRPLWALLALALVAGACGRSDSGSANPSTQPTTNTSAATTTANACQKEPLQATEIGVTPTDITIQVMADVGSPLAPGLFQGNFDALNAYATYINAKGGVGCRKLVVKNWDTKLDATESKNGLINACQSALALVGNNSLFNPDTKPMTDCVDKAGKATGVPDIAALANDVNEMCASTTYIIQGVSETCPITPGQPRPLKEFVGPQKWYLQQTPGLHGIFMVPGDLPTTVQSATGLIAAQQQAGIVFDGTMKVSGRDEQAAFTPRIQLLKSKNGNYVYNGSNDIAMIKMRKEAKAQDLNSVKVWACSLACYTKAMLAQGGADVEGTYVWMQFLPFEEADTNAELKAYIDGVGATKADSFGAQAWQAAAAFKQVIDNIVAKDGPNAITRARMLDELKTMKDFTANGWMGKKDLRGFSDCFLMMQIKNGKFERVYPTQRGTLDCNPANVVTVTLDPVAEAAKIQ